MATRDFFRRRRTYLIGIPVLLVLAVTVGPYVYIHFIEGKAPKPLSLDSVTTARTTTTAGTTGATSATSAAAATLDGTWKATKGSTVGYRVKEQLFGQSNTAVGRTSAVTGSLVLSGTTVQSASFTADLTKVSSDQGRRDDQFQHRIMDTATHPNATFSLAAPITLSNIPNDQVKITVNATGDLTLKGTQKSVTFAVSARRDGNQLEASGSIPITFADYGIDNPSGGPASTEDHGLLEFVVVFARSA